MKTGSNSILILLLFLTMIIWGATWTSAKLITYMAAPEVIIFWRFFFTFLSMIPVLLFLRRSIRINRKSLFLIILGSIFIVSYNKCFFLGLRYGYANVGGVLVTTMNPILIYLFSIIIFWNHISRMALIGLVMGFLGGAVLLEAWSINFERLVSSGNAYFLLASTSWALLTLTSEKCKGSTSPLIFSFYVFGLAALIDFVLALPLGIWDVFNEGWLFWSNLLFLSVGATTIATTIYFAASSRLGSQRAGSFIFLVPTSAVLISWIVLDERIKMTTIIGGILALIAVYLINIPKYSKNE
ncbi:hypothetical protein CEE37_09640 [candidate division LCP-89 bacterium B3_LCP]|uniref:EamA domain-containing protein n=1 Tax=candidate division LCP-89 bacterium B3_LCP TaxID=2012998 RepID=A0A532UYF8_UNCL8|nr:MAG: hypothetical protein CEE37_09640 [candidate division LCP-89 bacterium B3_LCP]